MDSQSELNPRAQAEHLKIAYKYYEHVRKYQNQHLVFLGLNTILMVASISFFFVSRMLPLQGFTNTIATTLCAIPSLFGMLLCVAWWMIRRRNLTQIRSLYSTTIDWQRNQGMGRSFLFDTEKDFASVMGPAARAQAWLYVILIVFYFQGLVALSGIYISLVNRSF